MAKAINWTQTAREQRQKILESLINENGNKKESMRFSLLLRIHLKYITQYNFAGIESNYPGFRETIVGNYKLFYKIRTDYLTIMGIFKNE